MANGTKDVVEIELTATDELTPVAKKAAGGFGLLRRSAARAEKTFKKLQKTGKKITSFLKTTAVLSAATATILFGLAKSAASVGDDVAKMSARLNLSVKTLSALQFQAELAGTSFQEASNGLRFMARSAFDANSGIKSFQRGFDQLNVSVVDNQGNLKDTEQLFFDVADAMSKMEAGTERMAAAQLVFGNRFGTAMIPLLIQGSKVLKDQAKDAEKLGLIWSEKDAKAAELFNDELAKLLGSFKGIARELGTEFLPAFAEFFTTFKDFVTENKTAIADFFGGIAEGISSFARFIQENDTLIISVTGLISILAGASVVFSGASGNMAALSLSLIALTASFSATSAAFATTKFVQFTDTLKKMREEADQTKFESMTEGLQNLLPEFDRLERFIMLAPARTKEFRTEFDALNKTFDELLEKDFSSTFSDEQGEKIQAMLEKINGLRDAIKDLLPEEEITTKIDTIKEAFDSFGTDVGQIFTDLGEKFPVKLIKGSVNALAAGFQGLITQAQTLSQFWEGLRKSFVKMIVQQIAQTLAMIAIRTILLGIETALFVLTGGGSAVSGGATGAIGKVFGAKNGAIMMGGFQPVQAFANGAPRITSPTIGVVGEGRFNEAIVPLPDGRSIPVQFQGGQGQQGNQITRQQTTIVFQLPDSSTVPISDFNRDEAEEMVMEILENQTATKLSA